jgi:hypothetical protein
MRSPAPLSRLFKKAPALCACAITARSYLVTLLSKLTILVVDRGGPEYSTSYRRAFPHSFAPARIGGGLGGGWALAHEGSNSSLSACIYPVLSTLLNRGFSGPGGCLCRKISVRDVPPGYAPLCRKVYLVQDLYAPQFAGRSGCQHNEDPGADRLL